MNYQKVYNQIVEKAISEKRKKYQGTYYEKHHIQPKCLGGADNKSNLVLLTAREHFICHWLLVRIYPNSTKLFHALWGMCNQKNKVQKRYVPPSRAYEEARVLSSKALSRLKTGTINSAQSERMRIDNPNFKLGVKEKQKLAKLGDLNSSKRSDVKRKIKDKMTGRLVTWGDKISTTRIERGLGKEPKSEDHKKKIGLSNSKPKTKVQCPHCLKIGGKGNMTRWHFDKCKIGLSKKN